ncbi:MAG: flavin reductase family protein [Anaerovoracaceae bacterium]
MAKRNFKPGTMVNPVPAVMVSCGEIDGIKNIITIAWTGIINSDPPMTYVSVRKERYSHQLIKDSGEFVINLVTKDLTFATDFCGVRSGRDLDKFAEQKLTPAPCELVSCPAIKESPVNIECKVIEIKEFPSHDMFIGEIVNVQVNEELIDEKDRIALEKAGLVAYCHGEYFGLNQRPIGRFGYSVMKAKTKKRIAAEKRSAQLGKKAQRRNRKK